jgi:hypothetical protein
MRLLPALLTALALSCTSTTSRTVGSSSTPPSVTASMATPSPNTQGIEAACAWLGLERNLLAKAIRGKMPITDAVEGQFAVAARRLAKAVGALEGTEAGLDLTHLADDASGVGNYNGTDVGDLLDLVSAFGNGAKRFDRRYCASF